MSRDRLEAEFGTYATWMAETALQLPPAERPAGVCRGTGDPELLEVVADELLLSRGDELIDAGCGLGGPGGWLSQTRGCSVTGVDVMHASVSGARTLFPNLKFVTSSLRYLPFAKGTFRGGTCLGVVELIDDKDRAFSELSRVLRERSRLILYDYVAVEDLSTRDNPAADRFVTLEDLVAAAERGGFMIVEARKIDEAVIASSPWREMSRRVRRRVAEAHRDDPRLPVIEAQHSMFNDLRKKRVIEPWLLITENANR